jgi:ribosome biogenesis protein ENP2
VCQEGITAWFPVVHGRLPAPPPPPLASPLQEKLGLSHLVGTPLLRAYMHGFFVDNRLYGKAKAIADPFAYDTYRAKRVAAKLEEERRSRISLVKKLPRVGEGRVGGGAAAAGRGRAGRLQLPWCCRGCSSAHAAQAVARASRAQLG